MNRILNGIQFSIMQKVERQVQEKLTMKKCYKKKIKVAFERASRRIFYRIFSDIGVRVKNYEGSSSFGCDEFGRDVEDGLFKYIQLLKNRKVQIHTVLVLGSRAKGSWKPQSDVDVAIIVSDLPKERTSCIYKRFFDFRRKLILSDLPLCLGIEPSGCCSKIEFLKRLEQFDIQALDAIFYGRVIYDDGFWPIVKMKYKEMEKKYGLKQIPLKEMLVAV